MCKALDQDSSIPWGSNAAFQRLQATSDPVYAQDLRAGNTALLVATVMSLSPGIKAIF